MRTRSTALATAALLGLGAAPEGALAQNVGVVPFQQGLVLARGLDAVSSLPRTDCVEGDTTEVPAGAIREVEFQITEVSSTADLLSALKVQSAASLNTGTFSASAELNYASRSRVQAFDSSLLTKVSVERRWRLLTSPRLKPEFATLLQEKPLEFRARCGDRFVSGILQGGTLVATLRAQTRNEEERRDISAAFTASYGPFSANGQLSEETARTLQSARTEVEGFVRGGGANPLPTALDDLRTRFRAFPQEVEQSGGVEVSMLLLDYGVLGSPGVPDVSTVALERMATLFWDLGTVEREVDFILANPTQFLMDPSSWRPQLARLKAEAQQSMDRIATAAQSCRADPQRCAQPTGLADPATLRVGYPLRFAGVCGPVTVSSPPTLSLFPLSQRTRGDADMAGHNPGIEIAAEARPSADAREANIRFTISMTEDRRDFTTFTGSRESQIATVAAEHPHCFLRPQDIQPRTGALTASGGKNNHDFTEYRGGTGLIESARCRSDTRGDETGRIGCTDIRLRPLVLSLQNVETRLDPGGLRALQAQRLQDVAQRQRVAATRATAGLRSTAGATGRTLAQTPGTDALRRVLDSQAQAAPGTTMQLPAVTAVPANPSFTPSRSLAATPQAPRS